MSPEDMDSFIFCIASKRSAQRLSKEMNDLNTYCPEKRPADKYDIPGAYFVMSEVSCWQSCISMFDYYLLDGLRIRFNADPHPAFHFSAEPDPTFHLNVDPDPALHENDANLRPTGL
jgi:hypothetical protein